MSAIPLQREVVYPESDGTPMGETDLHREEIVDLIEGLQERYDDVPDVYVAGNLFLYYRERDPRAVVAPDVFLVKGVPKGRRRIYRLWEEGQPPSLVIEVTSRDTASEDLSKKKDCYARLGVEEYFLHDPLEEYLQPPLQGYRLVAGRYEPIAPAADGSLASRVTGLMLRIEPPKLRLLDTATGEPLPWVQELKARFKEAEARRSEAEARLAAAEDELARLRRELARRREPAL
jgi:Uma2 family endonuclease